MIGRESLAARYFSSTTPFLAARVEVHQYIPATKSRFPLGFFTLQFQPQSNRLNFVLLKDDSSPIVFFPITSRTEIFFHSKDIWRISDPDEQMWVVQFKRMRDAYRGLATFGLVSAATDPTSLASWELPNQPEEGAAVGPDDAVRLSFHAFAVRDFPYVGDCLASHATLTASLSPTAGVMTFVDRLWGMFVGTTRVVYIPNNDDSRLPPGDIVVIATVEKSCRQGESVPLDGDYEYEYESEEEDTKLAPNIEPEPELRTESAPISVAQEPSPRDDEDEDYEEAMRKRALMSRMKKIGAAAPGMVPAFPAKSVFRAPQKSPPEPERAPEPTPTVPDPTPSVSEPASIAPEPEMAPVEPAPARPKTVAERLSGLERIAKRIEDLAQPSMETDPNMVITGISVIAVQVKTRQGQIERLQKQLAETKVKATGNQMQLRQVEMTRLDVEAAKRRNAALDKKVKENARQLKELQRSLDTASAKAKETATDLVKQLMNGVFQELRDRLESGGTFSGEEVSAELAQLLKNQAMQTFAAIIEKGLI
jgi:hypothetical protein